MTKLPGLEWYRKLLRGEITREQYSKLTDEDLKPITTPIYEGDISNE